MERIKTFTRIVRLLLSGDLSSAAVIAYLTTILDCFPADAPPPSRAHLVSSLQLLHRWHGTPHLAPSHVPLSAEESTVETVRLDD